MFDPQLGPDPLIALSSPIVAELAEGPIYRVQYVIELVGPRSVPAQAAAQLVTEPWYGALGRPEIFCMTPADTGWRPLTDGRQGAYDSVAACWDILSPQGLMTRTAAHHLFQQLDKFAHAIGRRSMPLPVPDEIDRIGNDLLKIQTSLDVGVSVVAMAKSGQVREKELWDICSRLGLAFSPAGSFDWRVLGFPYPLLSVTPIGRTDAFSVGAMQKGAIHEGVTVGFNVPRSPAPMASLDGALKVTNEVAHSINGVALDDVGRVLSPRSTDEMRRNLQLAIQTLEQVGVKPGSAAALKLF